MDPNNLRLVQLEVAEVALAAGHELVNAIAEGGEAIFPQQFDLCAHVHVETFVGVLHFRKEGSAPGLWLLKLGNSGYALQEAPIYANVRGTAISRSQTAQYSVERFIKQGAVLSHGLGHRQRVEGAADCAQHPRAVQVNRAGTGSALQEGT